MGEVSSCCVPVSSSVMLILYSVMIPFLVARGGGAQDTLSEVELTTEMLTFPGGLEGAVYTSQDIQHG